MILLILCLGLVFMVAFVQFLLLTIADLNEFEAITTVISMNVILYFAVTYIIEKASLMGWL